MGTEKDNSTLTEEDWAIINNILVGCKKFIHRISDRDPKGYSKARSHHQTKSLTSTSVYHAIPKIIKEKSKFRPSDIRENLPDKLQNIQYADLTKILQTYERMNMLSPVREEHQRRKRPGHPFKFEKDNKSVSGPKSYKGYSNYQNIVENVLAKPEARKIIYNHLLESGLLLLHIVSNVMKALYIEKENDKEGKHGILFNHLNFPTLFHNQTSRKVLIYV